MTILKNIQLIAFLLTFAGGLSSAFASSSDINSDPELIANNGETKKIQSKSSQDKYSFTLFDFFYTQFQPTSDSSSTISTESDEVEPALDSKTGL